MCLISPTAPDPGGLNVGDIARITNYIVRIMSNCGDFAVVYPLWSPDSTIAHAAPVSEVMTAPKSPRSINIPRTIILVGLMGAGKTCIGRELALRLDLPFVDADSEIEAAAGCAIDDIFRLYGEDEFRNGERRVMARLLDGPVRVLATGGGAFMVPETRALIAEKAVSVWLRADLDLLVKRCARRNTRPLLATGDPRKILADLIAERYPVYAETDVIIDTDESPHDVMVGRIVEALEAHQRGEAARVSG